jgi:uncharacterized protein (TIGR02599 family)
VNNAAFHHSLRSRRACAGEGFTLIEILVAAAVTVILVGILLSISTLTGNVVKQASSTLTSFSTARTAFDAMTQKLSQATLNTYLDYYDASGNQRSTHLSTNSGSAFVAVSYGRASDLQFYIRQNLMGHCGQEIYFAAPEAYAVPDADRLQIQSVQGLLNSCGYYVSYGDSALFQPTAITAHRYRYRLMQAMEPTESFSVFSGTSTPYFVGPSGGPDSASWIQNIRNTASGPLNGSLDVTPLADNVIALIVWPRLSYQDDPAGTSLSTDYTYDSQNPINVQPQQQGAFWVQGATADQLPPTVEVTMVVVDEPTVVRMYGAVGLPNPTASASPPNLEEALTVGSSGVPFKNVRQYQADISSIATTLAAAHANYQIFDATVALRESKWSQAPTQ